MSNICNYTPITVLSPREINDRFKIVHKELCYLASLGGGSSFITTLTTTGSSGPATVVAGTLNIPQYSGGGGGTSFLGAIRLTSTNDTLGTNDYTLLVDSTSGNIAIGVTPTNKQVWNVKKVSSDLNIVTVTPTSGTIDGAATYILVSQYDSIQIHSDNTNFFTI